MIFGGKYAHCFEKKKMEKNKQEDHDGPISLT